MDTIAVVGQFTGGDVQKFGLRLPGDASANAVDDTQAETSLGEDGVYVPAEFLQVSAIVRAHNDWTVGIWLLRKGVSPDLASIAPVAASAVADLAV